MLPAYVSSFHKIALLCRRDGDGQPVIPLINASLDTVSGVRLHVRDACLFHLMRLDGRTEDIVTIARDGDYTILELPALAPWEMVLLERHGKSLG